jgi:hypothetical protein
VTGCPSYIPQALVSLFIPFYISQGHGGSILTCLHTARSKFIIHFVLTLVRKIWFKNTNSNSMPFSSCNSEFYAPSTLFLIDSLYHCHWLRICYTY